MEIFEAIIKLFEVILWPFTLLFILIFFRKYLSNAMQRIGSMKVDNTGISMTFDKALEQTKEVFNKIRPEQVAKGMKALGGDFETPYEQLKTVKGKLESTLAFLATEQGISIQNTSYGEICKQLVAKGSLSEDQSKLMQSLLQVMNTATTSITQKQVEEIKVLYGSIN